MAAIIPAVSDSAVETQTAGRIAIGSAEPACRRSMAAVVGISCSEAVLSRMTRMLSSQAVCRSGALF